MATQGRVRCARRKLGQLDPEFTMGTVIHLDGNACRRVITHRSARCHAGHFDNEIIHIFDSFIFLIVEAAGPRTHDGVHISCHIGLSSGIDPFFHRRE